MPTMPISTQPGIRRTVRTSDCSLTIASIEQALARWFGVDLGASARSGSRHYEPNLLPRRRITDAHVRATLRIRDQHQRVTGCRARNRQLDRDCAPIDLHVAEELVVLALG